MEIDKIIHQHGYRDGPLVHRPLPVKTAKVTASVHKEKPRLSGRGPENRLLKKLMKGSSEGRLTSEGAKRLLDKTAAQIRKMDSENLSGLVKKTGRSSTREFLLNESGLMNLTMRNLHSISSKTENDRALIQYRLDNAVAAGGESQGGKVMETSDAYVEFVDGMILKIIRKSFPEYSETEYDPALYSDYEESYQPPIENTAGLEEVETVFSLDGGNQKTGTLQHKQENEESPELKALKESLVKKESKSRPKNQVRPLADKEKSENKDPHVEENRQTFKSMRYQASPSTFTSVYKNSGKIEI